VFPLLGAGVGAGAGAGLEDELLDDEDDGVNDEPLEVDGDDATLLDAAGATDAVTGADAAAGAGLGLGFARSAGTAAAAPTAVTAACWAGTATAGASDVLVAGEDFDLLAEPIANAAPNATRMATATMTGVRHAGVSPVARGVIVPCAAALLSISWPLRRRRPGNRNPDVQIGL